MFRKNPFKKTTSQRGRKELQAIWSLYLWQDISGWYFFPFMLIVFIFLGLFGYEAFHMRDEAILANVKLQVIREDFGHHPAVARTFHMLDSIYAEPISKK